MFESHYKQLIRNHLNLPLSELNENSALNLKLTEIIEMDQELGLNTEEEIKLLLNRIELTYQNKINNYLSENYGKKREKVKISPDYEIETDFGDNNNEGIEQVYTTLLQKLKTYLDYDNIFLNAIPFIVC